MLFKIERLAHSRVTPTHPRRTIARSYVFWLPLHFITYGAMPARHRLVWVSFCSIGFATLLSWSISEGDTPNNTTSNEADGHGSDAAPEVVGETGRPGQPSAAPLSVVQR